MSYIKFFKYGFSFLLLLIVLRVQSHAADIYHSAELVNISTPVIKPESSNFQPLLGTYNYTVSWQGIPAAELEAVVEQDGLNYKITTKAKTYKGIDIFYKLRYNAEGLISAVDYFPINTRIEHRENSRHRFIEIIFNPDGNVDAVRIDRRRDEIKSLSFDPNNFMLDPFGAAFLARSVNWEKGAVREFDTFNGFSRYHISLTAEERRKIRYNGEERDVWVITPLVRNLVNPAQTSKLRRAHIYVSADDKRDILKIVSSVFIGNVYTELKSFQPSPLPQFAPRFARDLEQRQLVK